MSEYIERDIVLQIAQISTSKQKLIERIKQTPTADVAPVRHGQWVDNHNGTASCSKCATWINTERLPYARHCLYCGAQMDKDGDE